MSDEQDKMSEAETLAPEPSNEAVDVPAPDADGGEQPSDAATIAAEPEETGSDAAASPAEAVDAGAAAAEPASDASEPAEAPPRPADDAGQASEQAAETAAEAVERAGDAAEPIADAPATETAAESDAAEGVPVGGGEPVDAFDAAADLVAESSDDAPAEAADAAVELAETAEVWTDPLADVEKDGPGTEANEADAEGAAAPVAVDDDGVDGAGGATDVAGGAPDVAGDAPDGGGTAVEVLPLEVAEAMAQTTQRRRRLSLYVAVPALVIGVFVLLTQLRFSRGGDDTPAEVRDWETGMALVEAGHIPKGIEMLESVVATLPQGAERAQAHVRLADEYRRLGETEPHYFNSAIRHYTSALDWAESAVAQDGAVSVDEPLFRTGQCFAALGSHEMALEFYEQIDTEFPTSAYRPQSRFEAGEALLAIGQYERGRRMLAEVAAAYRGDPLGEEAFFRFADSFGEQARSLEAEQ